MNLYYYRNGKNITQQIGVQQTQGLEYLSDVEVEEHIAKMEKLSLADKREQGFVSPAIKDGAGNVLAKNKYLITAKEQSAIDNCVIKLGEGQGLTKANYHSALKQARDEKIAEEQANLAQVQ